MQIRATGKGCGARSDSLAQAAVEDLQGPGGADASQDCSPRKPGPCKGAGHTIARLRSHWHLAVCPGSRGVRNLPGRARVHDQVSGLRGGDMSEFSPGAAG